MTVQSPQAPPMPQTPAQRREMAAVVRAERQRIDRHVAAVADPEDAVEVDVPLLVEARPAPEIRSMQSLHAATLPCSAGRPAVIRQTMYFLEHGSFEREGGAA